MREAYHRRCLALIADLEDAEAAFGGAKPKVLLRVDVDGTLAVGRARSGASRQL